MKSKSILLWLLAATGILALATSGCATKKYVQSQVAPVNQKLAQYQKQTNDKIATIWNKQEQDMSQVNERISTTDQKVGQLAEATQQAQGTASRAMDASEANASATSANTAAINQLIAGVTNALNYQLVDTADVTFGFNKTTLTPQARAALDQIASKMQSMPRGVIELAGFTDKIGSANYNLGLSRRRAEAVQQYLVRQKVPVRSIHIVALGQEAPPPGMEAELSSTNSHPTKGEKGQLARRVRIQLYGAGDITSGTASRSESEQ